MHFIQLNILAHIIAFSAWTEKFGNRIPINFDDRLFQITSFLEGRNPDVIHLQEYDSYADFHFGVLKDKYDFYFNGDKNYTIEGGEFGNLIAIKRGVADNVTFSRYYFSEKQHYVDFAEFGDYLLMNAYLPSSVEIYIKDVVEHVRASSAKKKFLSGSLKTELDRGIMLTYGGFALLPAKDVRSTFYGWPVRREEKGPGPVRDFIMHSGFGEAAFSMGMIAFKNPYGILATEHYYLELE